MAMDLISSHVVVTPDRNMYETLWPINEFPMLFLMENWPFTVYKCVRVGFPFARIMFF